MTSFAKMQKLLPDLLTMNPATLENSLREFTREDLGIFSKMVARQYSEEEITDLLFRAVDKDDDYRTVELALLSGADYEKEKSIGYSLFTPLTLAAKYSYPRIVALLLKYGADPNHVVGIWNHNPLMESLSYNPNPLIAELLIDAGANVNAVSRGETALKIAVVSDVLNLDLIRRLLENGADVNVKDRGGDDVLSVVLGYTPDNKELISLLTTYRDFYLRENERMLSEHMIPDLAKITMKYLD